MPLASLRTILFVAFRQLWERKLLNGIAVMGVVFGVLTLIAMNGLMNGFQSKFLNAMLKVSPHITISDTELRPVAPILVRHLNTFVVAKIAHESPSDRQGRIKRPQEIVRALQALPQVQAASASLASMVLIEYGGKTKSLDLRGIDVNQQERVTAIAPYLLDGKFTQVAFAIDGIAVGSGIAKDLGLHVGDVVHAAAPGGQPLDMKVVGIFEVGVPPVDKARAYASLRNVQTLVGKPDIIGQIEVRLNDPEDAIAVNDEVEKMFGYDAESWKEANANFLSLFVMQNTIISFVIGAILLVGGFGILSIQIMIVLQKQRDIAILRSVGLRRNDILLIFLVQGMTIAMVGGLLGDGAGKLALRFIATLKVHIEGLVKADSFVVSDDPRLYWYGLLFAVLVGTIASLIPAWRGSKVEPVDVLRGQIG